MLIALGVILLVIALFLVVAVLMQHGKSKKLSGTIAGGAETFFGKNKGSTLDKMLSKITTVVAIVFVIVVVVVYVMQDTATEEYLSFNEAVSATSTEDAVDDSAEAADAAVEEAVEEAAAETEAAE